MVIKGGSFYPQPNVDSQAVLLELKEDAAAQTFPACFYPLVRQLFSSRRKTIKNNMAVFLASQGLNLPVQDVLGRLDGGKRAENLSFGDFLALAKTIEDMGI
jgi:16S rRNA (adenine1518-N6/adenine1519-N6)-dimethyltransferase